MPVLAPGITWIPTRPHDRNNAYLVEGDDGFTLVDVGWASAPKLLTDALEDLDCSVSDIRRIVLTHAHPDHVKGAAELRSLSGAHVLIHAADADWLRSGQVPASGRSGRIGRCADRLPLLHWKPVEPDGTVTHGDVIEHSNGLRVVHTPGHSPGHIALLHEPTGVLLVGDAVFHGRDGLSQGPAAFSIDPVAREQSLSSLPVDVSAVGFAHGSPFIGGAVGVYTAWMESSARLTRPAAESGRTNQEGGQL